MLSADSIAEAPGPRQSPELISSWPAKSTVATRSGVGVLVINFNTAMQTVRCLQSLSQSDLPPDWVLILDNASQPDDYQRLLATCAALPDSELRLYRSEVNLGFAGGSNFLVGELLSMPDCGTICMLNNDAVAMPGMVRALVESLQGEPSAGMAGGRMHRLGQPDVVDTLGITIYASLMPADRKDTADTYLGPTGGCLLVSRAVALRLIEVSGYFFDSRYFCYCEDTDLVLRAVLLGYRPAYVDDLIALHEGQASSGGGYNRFIAYHGLRNAIWMHFKLIPGALLVKYLPLLAIAHLLTVAKLLLNGELRLTWEIYRDALGQWPVLLAERRRFVEFRRISAASLDDLIVPRFYRRGYLAFSLRQLWRRYSRKAPG